MMAAMTRSLHAASARSWPWSIQVQGCSPISAPASSTCTCTTQYNRRHKQCMSGGTCAIQLLLSLPVQLLCRNAFKLRASASQECQNQAQHALCIGCMLHPHSAAPYYIASAQPPAQAASLDYTPCSHPGCARGRTSVSRSTRPSCMTCMAASSRPRSSAVGSASTARSPPARAARRCAMSPSAPPCAPRRRSAPPQTARTAGGRLAGRRRYAACGQAAPALALLTEGSTHPLPCSKTWTLACPKAG